MDQNINLSKKPQNINFKKFLVKFAIFCFCLVGFLIHCYIKIKIFYDQQPITEYLNSNNENLDKDDLVKIPAISLCFSGNLFKKSDQPSFMNLIKQKDSSLLYNSENNFSDNIALLEENDSQFDDGLSFRYNQLKNKKNEPRLVSSSQMISVDQAFNLVSKPRFTIKCDLVKPTKLRKLTRLSDSPLPCEQIAQVIESINYEAKQKCLTFFSQLQQTNDVENDDFLVYRNDLNGGDLIRIQMNFEEELLNLSNEQEKIHFLMHSNVEMPNFQLMKTYSLSSSHKYIIYFDHLNFEKQNINKSPCRQYETVKEKDKNFYHQVPKIILEYKNVIKNQLNKLLFKQENENQTRIISNDQQETYSSKITFPKSQSDCIDKCHLEINKKFCICLPVGVNIRRELLSADDLFCDEFRCLQEDLPSSSSNLEHTTTILNSDDKENNLIKTKTDELERIYAIPNSKFISKRYERFKKCLKKNNCISNCQEDKYDFTINEKANFDVIVQHIISNLQSKITSRTLELTKNSKRLNIARNYYPNGFYFDPNFSSQKIEPKNTFEKRFSNKNQNENKNFIQKKDTFELKNRTVTSSYLFPNFDKDFENKNKNKIAIDFLGKNDSFNTDNFKLNTTIVVKKTQDESEKNFQNRKKYYDTQNLTSPLSETKTDINLDHTTVSLEKNDLTSPNDLNTNDPDSIDENSDKEESLNYDHTSPSVSIITKINFKKTTKLSTNKPSSFITPSFKKKFNVNKTFFEINNTEDENFSNPTSNDDIEERHNRLKPFSVFLSVKNNLNGNKIFKEKLFYTWVDLTFDIFLIAVVWLGFSIYSFFDYLIYFIIKVFWFFIKTALCINFWNKKTLRNHRVIDSASNSLTTVITDRSLKGSASSQETNHSKYNNIS